MFNFKKIFKRKLIDIGVKKNQTIVLTFDLLKIILFLKKKKVELNLEDIVNPIKEVISKDGNIIVYSFFWEFFKTGLFDYDNSKTASGSLSNYLLKNKEFLRTKHPVYSILAWGKNKKDILKINHTDCFSRNSPFGYLLKKNSKLLFLDIDFKKTGFPFFHVAEQQVGVYYRFFKEFKGIRKENGKKKKISFKMFVRKENYKMLTYYSSQTEKILKKKNAYKKLKLFTSELTLLDLKKLYKLTIDQLKIEKKMILRKETNLN